MYEAKTKEIIYAVVPIGVETATFNNTTKSTGNTIENTSHARTLNQVGQIVRYQDTLTKVLTEICKCLPLQDSITRTRRSLDRPSDPHPAGKNLQIVDNIIEILYH